MKTVQSIHCIDSIRDNDFFFRNKLTDLPISTNVTYYKPTSITYLYVKKKLHLFAIFWDFSV